MAEYAGIWIDQEKADIVNFKDGKEILRIIESNVEKHVRLFGGSRSKTPFGPQDVASERKPVCLHYWYCKLIIPFKIILILGIGKSDLCYCFYLFGPFNPLIHLLIYMFTGCRG